MKVLILSDIHGNLAALDSVLGNVEGYDEVIVLGDLVDYGPWPGEVIDRVKMLGARVVRGNHDHAVAYGVDCRCGEETHWLSVWFRENITFKLISREDREWLGRIPLTLKLELDGLDVTAVHAAPSNPMYAYLYPWLGKREICNLLRRGVSLRRKSGECPKGLYMVGHTHHQFLLTLDSAVVVNPGSVGQPRDGVPMAGYAILDTSKSSLVLGRVKYDPEPVIERLKELGVKGRYFEALRHMLLTGKVPPKPGEVKG